MTLEETTYDWDARNRLVGISGPFVTANFTYDALGRRIEKTVNSVTTTYVYDGWDIIQETTDTVTTNYTRTLNIDEPLAFERTDGTIRYYVQDALGSVIALTDAEGLVTTTYNYDAFGAVTINGTDDQPFQYTGRENDGTGLYYYRARYYSPEMRRFISEDPIGLRGGINFYEYALNNPFKWVDPSGLKSASYSGWEIQAVGGMGKVYITCCDGEKLRKITYFKICLGGGFIAGISSGGVSNTQGASCSDPPLWLIGAEFGIYIFDLLGGEYGISFSNSGGMSQSLGAGAGFGGKATVCVYLLTDEEIIGCCGQ